MEVFAEYEAIPTVNPAPTYNSPLSANPRVESTVKTVSPIATLLVIADPPVGSKEPWIVSLLRLIT